MLMIATSGRVYVASTESKFTLNSLKRDAYAVSARLDPESAVRSLNCEVDESPKVILEIPIRRTAYSAEPYSGQGSPLALVAIHICRSLQKYEQLEDVVERAS